MFRRPLLALVASLLLAISLVAGIVVARPAAAQQAGSSSDAVPTDTPRFGDIALIDALLETDLLQAWLDTSPVAAEVSLLTVTGSPSYDSLQAAFVAQLNTFTERHRHVHSRSERLDVAAAHVVRLDDLTREIRRALAVNDVSSALSLTDDQAQEAKSVLSAIDNEAHWLGFSLDPVALAEHHLASIRDDLAQELVAITAATDEITAKGAASVVARLTAIHHDLANVRDLVEIARTSDAQARTEIDNKRAEAIASIPALHQARTLASTEVGGLPVVTVDAYVKAAEVLDPSCPVDWTLLAGIGRIESRHGTLDGATVQVSGRVTTSIYGPLLDGGATAREAEAAELEAEAELLALEAEAAEAERIAEEEAFEASVWGQLRRAEEAATAAAADALGTAGDAGTGQNDAAAAADDDDAAADGAEPAHDPRLWGESASVFDPDPDTPAHGTNNSDETTDGDAEDDGEEPVIKGNGFAVIRDSDNGRLDGNPRWDRAVGPMQFIPETWSYWETDGNGDGVADPQNLYDAAASAGQFLCHLSRTRGASPWTFVLGYNSSDTYVRNVIQSAEALRTAELPDIDALTS